MKQFYTIFWIVLLAALCTILIWWKVWLGIPYSIVWVLIGYELKNARKAPPHELKSS